MAKKLYSIDINGKRKHWTFRLYLDPKYIDEWRDDGLVIEEIVNTIPYWINEIGMTRIWCFFQDIFNFKKPL